MKSLELLAKQPLGAARLVWLVPGLEALTRSPCPTATLAEAPGVVGTVL